MIRLWIWDEKLRFHEVDVVESEVILVLDLVHVISFDFRGHLVDVVSLLLVARSFVCLQAREERKGVLEVADIFLQIESVLLELFLERAFEILEGGFPLIGVVSFLLEFLHELVERFLETLLLQDVRFFVVKARPFVLIVE